MVFGIIDAVEQRDELYTRVFFFDFGNLGHRIVEHGDVGCTLCARHGKGDDLLAAGNCHGFLFAEAVGYFSDIGQFNRTATTKADLRLAQGKCIDGVAKNAHRLA